MPTFQLLFGITPSTELRDDPEWAGKAARAGFTCVCVEVAEWVTAGAKGDLGSLLKVLVWSQDSGISPQAAVDAAVRARAVALLVKGGGMPYAGREAAELTAIAAARRVRLVWGVAASDLMLPPGGGAETAAELCLDGGSLASLDGMDFASLPSATATRISMLRISGAVAPQTSISGPPVFLGHLFECWRSHAKAGSSFVCVMDANPLTQMSLEEASFGRAVVAQAWKTRQPK